MEFSTKTEAPYPGTRIGMGEKGFSIGSCFAENIAARMAVSGFHIMSNPFGVLYNPASISRALEILSEGVQFSVTDLVRNGGVWCSPLFHGSFSGTDPDVVAERMNRAVKEGRKEVEEADFVMISFGTPWVYTVAKDSGIRNVLPTGSAVANCHKFPPGNYCRKRLDVGEIVSMYNVLSERILKGKKTIYTVSPVRYLKDTLHGSNLGKAVLHLAVERICSENSDSFYFPAYEILTDELRDYRYYADDMAHPSPLAVEYIWERFREWILYPQDAGAAVEIEKLSAAMHHRVGEPGSPGHLQFIRTMISRTAALASKYPAADLKTQSAFFASQLEQYDVKK